MAYQQDLSMYRYEDVTLNFTANTDVTAANITGWTLAFTVRDQFNGSVLLQRTTAASNGVTISNATVGNFSVAIAAANTAGLDPNPNYKYDVQRTDAGANSVLAIGTFSLKPEVRLN